MTRREIEQALDQGRLMMLVAIGHTPGPDRGKYWKVRRNGQTKLWATRPDDYRIPVKAGLSAHNYITPTTLDWQTGGLPLWRILP